MPISRFILMPTLAFGVFGLCFVTASLTAQVTVTPSRIDLPATVSSGTFTINAPFTDWQVERPALWLLLSSPTNRLQGTGNQVIGFDAPPNPSIYSRTAYVRVGQATVVIHQSGAPSTPVQVGAYPSLISGDGETVSVAIRATGTWIARSSADWFSVNYPLNFTGRDDGVLGFVVEPNPSASPRSGVIQINGSEAIRVNQSGGKKLVLDPPEVVVDPGESSGTVRVIADPNGPPINWIPSPDVSWITAGPAGSGSGSFTYSVAAGRASNPITVSIYLAKIFVPIPNPLPRLKVTVRGSGVPLVGGLQYVPVKPCRLVDTRERDVLYYGGPPLEDGEVRSFMMTQTPCDIPQFARAYALNVTVVPRTKVLSYITIWPTDLPQPFVSTLNSPDGRIKANAAIVPAGSFGSVDVAATDPTDLVLDINGYFIEPLLNPDSLAFYPVKPCRIADTRLSAGELGGPAIPGGGQRSFPVLSANCGIPASARAYSMNATVVPSGPLGYLTMWPSGEPQPFVSTLNAPTGSIVANAAIVPSGARGDVSVFASNPTHVVLDINGYFAPPGLPDAQRFFPVAPCRLLDTREANGNLGGPVLALNSVRGYALPSSNCGFPGDARAYSLNATVVPAGQLGYLTLWPSGQAQPFVSTLNAIDDRIVANAAIVPAGTGGAISSYVTDRTHLILDTNGYFAP